ncbi:hypothetical protein [Vulcaniibacterium tengchongense]|uniref:Uncharacterized protein n=1 Tax=Vulcaniibacterium tengchongense TaxID=1273429 RepID=A0A3N4VDL4_9GAMM|nr:hypothetical protein [Vulcaniibacterium tengchongense]RPE79883.1 hypothetical protein EDC50_1712 [Vulcaniibacterium tengchongense]
MRWVIAGVIGGLVMFVWSALAHTALPLGGMGVKVANGQDAALAEIATASANQGAGVYLLPGMTPEQWADDAARQAFVEKYAGSPYAFVVYRPEGNPNAADMAPSLVCQLAANLVGGLLLAWVLARVGGGFAARALLGAGAGLFAWLAVNLPYWTWYRFPTEFTVAALIEQTVGWGLAGAAIAAWLRRGGVAR